MGSYLLPKLSSKHHITVLTRNKEKGEKLHLEGIDYVLADLSEFGRNSNSVGKQDIVIYMAIRRRDYLSLGGRTELYISHDYPSSTVPHGSEDTQSARGL